MKENWSLGRSIHIDRVVVNLVGKKSQVWSRNIWGNDRKMVPIPNPDLLPGTFPNPLSPSILANLRRDIWDLIYHLGEETSAVEDFSCFIQVLLPGGGKPLVAQKDTFQRFFTNGYFAKIL